MLTAQMLEARGYTVLQAVNGESAMSLVKRHRNQIDLIVTDVVMPQATGAAFAARLRSQGLRIPILLISGYFDVDRFAEGDQSPAPLLRKPYTGSELAAAVRKLLDAPRDSGT